MPLRADLKRMLRELADEGSDREAAQEAASSPARCPRPCLPMLPSRDSDGDLIATPDEWDEEAHGPAAENPHRRAAQDAARRSRRHRRPRALARRGDRGATTAFAHRGRVIRIIDRAKHRVLGIFRGKPQRRRPAGAGRQEACSGSELAIPAGATADAQDGDLIAVETSRAAAARTADRPRGRAARLAASRARGQPDRDPRARHPVTYSAARRMQKPRPRSPRPCKAARTGGTCRSSPSIRPTPRIMTTRFRPSPIPTPNNRGGFIVNVAIADVAHYVQPGSALDREALVRGNSVYFPDRVVPMLPERISNDLCSLRPQRGPRRARGAHGHRRRRPQALAHLPPHHDALGGASSPTSRRRLAIDGRTDEDTEPLVAPVLAPLYAAYEAHGERARDERAAARSRSARAQDPAQSATAPSTA